LISPLVPEKERKAGSALADVTKLTLVKSKVRQVQKWNLYWADLWHEDMIH